MNRKPHYMPYNDDTYQSTPTPQGEFRRTAEDVERTRLDLVREYKLMAQLWGGIIAVFTLLMCLSQIWVGVPAMVFLAAFLFIRNKASYDAAQSANAMTLGAVYTPNAWSSGNTGTVKLIKDLSKRFDLPAPNTIVYTGNSFGGEYDPNTSTLTMGKYLADFETDASYATGLHECCHHIILNEPVRGRWQKMKLEIAGFTRLFALGLAILYMFMVLFSSVPNTQSVFSLFVCMLILSKAFITTHEYDTNALVRSLLFDEDSPQELNVIKDRERAYSMLKNGESTYTVDLIGWIVIALFICILLPMAL